MAKNRGILHGYRVLDFGRYIAGPFCGTLLGDYGAEVIRIERVNGSEDRFLQPVTNQGEGSMFLQLNRNKLDKSNKFGIFLFPDIRGVY